MRLVLFFDYIAEAHVLEPFTALQGKVILLNFVK